MSKKVVWEDESTNATVNVLSHSTPDVNLVPMRVLFVGGLCYVHGLTASTISNSLAAITQKAEVDYHLFQTGKSVDDRHGTLKKGEVLDVKEEWLKSNHHQLLGKFLSQIADSFSKTNYDYVVLEFDGNRIWSTYNTSKKTDIEIEKKVAEYLAPYYDAQNPHIIWITDGSGQTGLKSDPWLDEYFRPSTFMPNMTELDFTNAYRGAVALLDPKAHPGYNPGLSGYTPFVTNGTTCFGYKDEKFVEKKGTFYAGRPWDAQIAYTNSSEVVNKLNEIIKVVPYNIESSDQIQVGEGLSITGVKAQILPCTTDELKQKYKDVAAVEAAEPGAWTRLYEWKPESGLTYADTTLGITKSLSVEMAKNKVVLALTNMSYDAWTRLQIEVADNGEFRTTSRGAVYNKITKQWEKDPNDGKAHTVYVDEKGGRLDVEGEAKTEVLWAYDTRTIKADVTNGKAWINGEQTNELGVAVGNDVTVRHEGDPDFVLQSVTVDGVPSSRETEIHFKDIQDNHQVTVVYGVANLPIEVDGKTQDPDAPGGLPVPPDPENTGDNETGVKNVLRVYDGIATNLVIDVTDPDDGRETIVYSTNEWETVLSENPTFVDAGTNKVWYAISADGYKSVTNYAWVTIVPRSVTLTAPSAEKAYDGTPLVSNAVEVTAGSFAPNEGVAVASCTGSRTDVGESVNVLGYELKGNTKPDNYVITEANGTLKVTPAHVDDPSHPGDPAPDTGLDFGPGWTGDVPYKGEAWEPEVSCTNRLGTMDPEKDYDVAYYDNVDSTNRALVVITGKGNYTGVFTNVFNITKVPLTATADDKSLVYGSEVPGAGFYTFTYEGFVHDEDESVVETAPTFSSAYAKTSPVGPLPIEKATDGAARNYEFVYVPGTLTVTKRPVSLVSEGKTFVYDGSEHAWHVLSGTEGFVAGESYSTNWTGRITDVGTAPNAFAIVFGGTAKESNYELSTSFGTLEVTPAHVDDPSHPGDPAPDTGLDFGPGWTGDVPYKGEAWEPEVSCTNRLGTMDPEKDYDVAYYDNVDSTNRALVVITGKGNYTGVFTNVFNITKVPLTATADNKSLVYGSEVPGPGFYTFTYEGFVHDEDESVVETAPTFSSAYAKTSPVGTLPIEKATDGAARNYEFVYAPGTLTVTKRPVSLVSEGKTFVYDGLERTWHVLSGTEGFVAGESYSTNWTGRITDVGTAPNAFEIVFGGTAKESNYELSTSFGTLEVTPAHVDDPSHPGDPAPDTGLDFGPGWTGDVPYKGEAWEPEVSCTNRLGTLDPEKDYDVAYYDNVDSTNRALVVITGKGNYTGVFTNVFNITKVPLTATADNKSLVYGSEVPGPGFYTFTYEGFVHDEDESVVETAPTFSSAYTPTTPVGTLPIEKATDGAARNYEFVYVPGTLTVVESAPCFGAELKWVFCSNTGTYFAQLKVTCLNASDGFSYTVGKMRYCFQDRVEDATLKLGLWDARKNKALSKVPQVETLDGQSYSYFPLVDPNPDAKNGGWAPSVSKSYGPADDNPVMTAAERLSTPEMRVYRRVNPSYHNEEIVLDGNAPSAFVGWLVWEWTDATGAARTSMIPVTAGEPKAGYSLMLDTAPLDRPLSTGEMDERIAAGVAFDELTDVKLTITSFALGTSDISGILCTQNARTGRTGVPGVNAQIVLKVAATPDGSFGKAATATANPDGRFAFERPAKGSFFKLELHALPLLK